MAGGKQPAGAGYCHQGGQGQQERGSQEHRGYFFISFLIFFRPHSSLCGRFFVFLFFDFVLLFLGFGDFV